MSLADSVSRWRGETPGCANRLHLNNAGAALMPQPVIDAITGHIALEASIGGYEAADAQAPAVEAAYDAIAAIINAQPRNMAIVANATAGFVQALSSLDLERGDVIVTTRSDYTSYQIQYLALAKKVGVQIVHAEDLPEGGVDAASVREVASHPRCRVVHVSWVPTHSGLVQDVESVGAVCEELGVPFLVDACQAVGQMPIDIERVKCDYLAVTARKFLRGPRGIGFLYASDRALSRGDHPLFVDMRGARWTGPESYEVAETAIRYEDWEFPYALVLGLGAAARYANAVSVNVAHERSWSLAAALRTRLDSIDGVTVLDRGQTRCAIVTAKVDGWYAPDLTEALRKRRINSAASLRWYAQLDFAPRGIESAIRLSPHYYNTEDELDEVVGTIAELAASGSTR
jgi:selenocysteine lyase/cysteine desulfurase